MRGVVALVALLFVVYAFAQNNTFTIDVSQSTSAFPHYWEECVGSGHATLGLRSDWQRHLTQAHNDIGFKSVRFHGVFDDDMSVYFGENDYSFFNIDEVYDFLVGLGMRPYVEMSFMPELLASGNETIMHYKGNVTPPKNYTQWNMFITAFGTHLIERYGIDEVSQWSFEVGNEPNCGFWSGDQQSYFYHYHQTALALKNASSLLRVGGPVTCQSAWIPEFIQYCQQNNVPIDFIATHEYPTDINPIEKDMLFGVMTTAKKQAGDYPLYYSEFNDGLYSDPQYHDTPYASAFLMYTLPLVQGIPDLLSWWTFTDIFEEPGQTSSSFGSADGWGLLNIYQIPKPAYRAFQLLHTIGDEYMPVSGVSSASSVGVWAVYDNVNNKIDIIAYNFDIPSADVQPEAISIVVSNLSSAPVSANMTVIDELHSNPAALWYSMGSPMYPTQDQIDQIMQESQLVFVENMPTQVNPTTVSWDVTVAPWGVVFISLYL